MQLEDLLDVERFQYPHRLEMPKIIQHEVLQTIKHFSIKKVLESDQILNKVLKALACEICSYLEQVFNNSLKLSHYFLHFRRSVIVIMCKPKGNWDYINLKNYWPINQLNTLGKIIEAILATNIIYIAIVYNLLPKTHFGGQCGSYIKIAIPNLLEKNLRNME